MSNKRSPQEELERRTPRYVIYAFSLVVALAWNEATKDFIERHFASGLLSRYKFLYALILTISLIGVITVVHWINDVYIKTKRKIGETFGGTKRENNLRILY